MSNVVSANIQLPFRLQERIQSLAKTKSLSAHSLMLQALENYVDNEEQRAKFRQDAINAQNEYLRTGLHVNNQEVMDWLEDMSQGLDTELPKCHL